MGSTADTDAEHRNASPNSPLPAANEGFSTAAPDTTNAAAAVLAEKYAALVQLLSSSSGQLPDGLAQQLQQDLEACLAAWPAQAGPLGQQAAKAEPCQQQGDHQQYEKSPAHPNTKCETAVAIAHSAGGCSCPDHSNNSSNAQHDSQQKQQQQQQNQQEILDSPESQQTQIAGAFNDYGMAETAKRMLTIQQQPQHQQQQHQLHSFAPAWAPRSTGAVQPPTRAMPAAAAASPAAAAVTGPYSPQYSPPAPAAAVCSGSAAPQQYVLTMKSGYRGLTWDRKDQRWRVRVHFVGKQHHVGRFADEVEAARHFDSAAYYLFGDKAITNFGIEAAKAHNGPVPASIRALLQNNAQGTTTMQPQGMPAAPMPGSGFEAASLVPPAAVGGGGHAYPAGVAAGDGSGYPAAVFGGSTADSAARQQSRQYRQLPAHHWPAYLAGAGNAAAAPGPVGPSSRVATAAHVSRQRQVTYPPNTSKQQQQMQSPQYHHQPQQQWQGQIQGRCVSAQPPDSSLVGIPDWLNKQVQRMEDLRQPVAKAARVSDANAVFAGAAQPQMRVSAQSAQAPAVAPGVKQQQQLSAPSMSAIAMDVDMGELEQQLSSELLQLHKQLQQGVLRSDSQTPMLSQHAVDKKLKLIQQLRYNIQELQQVVVEEDQHKQQQQQRFDHEQQGHREQRQGAAVDSDGQTLTASDVSAFLSALLALPGFNRGTPPAPQRQGSNTLVGQKRSTPEPDTETKPPISSSAAAAAQSHVLADPATQATADALSALAAVIAALQQGADEGGSGGEPAAASGRGCSAEPLSPNGVSQEAYAAFFPCKS